MITIGITCCGEGDWLLECWQSVLAQTDDRWTAVLVMDGTMHPRTREIFEKLEHPKLRKYAMLANVGPYPTRNKAFEMTETPYHFYLDGDDQLLPDSVALVLGTFARHPDAGFVYGDYEYFGSEQSIKHFPRAYTANDLLTGHHPTGPCAYRKAAWEQLGGFASELARGAGDFDFHIGLMEAGITGRHCGTVFYRYRAGHASVSGSHRAQRGEKFEIMVRRHPRFFQDPQTRRQFLAHGYERAAVANQVAGNLQQAARLSWGAIRHGRWNDRKMWALLIRGLFVRHA